MGFPPAETAAKSREYHGNLNFFGGPHDKCVKSSAKLARLEKERADASMFVFLSDVWLDRPAVLQMLNKMFAGYAAMPPTCFVLMGNFLSEPYGSRQARVLSERLAVLGEMIAEYPELVQTSRFVFVPGPADPGFANILPRPKIPDCVVGDDFRRRVPSAIFATNPCRIQFCTREIVLFREDIVTKMCRNCVYFPESGDIPSHFARTLTSQAHLAPLPLHTCPVYWDFDAALRLYPLPDLVVVGDKFDPFSASEHECRVVNPGSFAKTEFSFKTYIPHSGEVEDSQVPAD